MVIGVEAVRYFFDNGTLAVVMFWLGIVVSAVYHRRRDKEFHG